MNPIDQKCQVNAQILDLAQQIHQDYPELSKYLEEMYVVLPNAANRSISAFNLQCYHDSVEAMRDGYAALHPHTPIRD